MFWVEEIITYSAALAGKGDNTSLVSLYQPLNQAGVQNVKLTVIYCGCVAERGMWVAETQVH